MAGVFRQVLEVPNEEGAIFKTGGVQSSRSAGGERVQRRHFGCFRLSWPIYLGYGNTTTPGVPDIDYPSFLDLPHAAAQSLSTWDGAGRNVHPARNQAAHRALPVRPPC